MSSMSELKNYYQVLKDGKGFHHRSIKTRGLTKDALIESIRILEFVYLLPDEHSPFTVGKDEEIHNGNS